jgi:hypothetical protein
MLVALLVLIVGLVLANMLGVAAAEAPTAATPVRTVSVEGVASVPIAQGANRATATTVYREGMAAALADGQNKAEFLAGKAAVTLASVQSIAEGDGSIECTAAGEEENRYVQYEGEQPDFPTRSSEAIAPEAPLAAGAPTVRKTKKPLKRRKKHVAAKKASATTCTLSAELSLVYAID